MAAQVRVLRRRIRSVQSTKKITKAMELVATRRIAKAQAAGRGGAAVRRGAHPGADGAGRPTPTLDHPLLTARPRTRAGPAILVDHQRPRAGRRLQRQRAPDGQRAGVAAARARARRPVLYVIGRKGVGVLPVPQPGDRQASWTGFSEQPTFADAREVGDDADRGVRGRRGRRRRGRAARTACSASTSCTSSTPSSSRCSPRPRSAKRIAPLEVEESEEEAAEGCLPAYEFEPEPEELLDALLPKYINTRIYAALLESAARESAARRRAMKSATDNAERADQDLHPRGQPGPAGRDHPGDQRDRRRRRRARRGRK